MNIVKILGGLKILLMKNLTSLKKKLLEKQKEGKKKMRQLGSVEVPSEAFMSILKIDSSDNK